MSIFRKLVDWRRRRAVLAATGLSVEDRLRIVLPPIVPAVKPSMAGEQARLFSSAERVGWHRREPAPILPSRQPPAPGGTDWWLWHGARLIAERHREHPYRPGICEFCAPGTAWPCAAVDTASRADAMSRLISAGMWHQPQPVRRYRRAEVAVGAR